MTDIIPTGGMSVGQVNEFLQASRNAVLATLRTDGSAQLTPVWYLFERDALYVMITADSAKYRNLKRDPRISLCIDGGAEDYRYVTVYGSADFVERVDDWREQIRFQCFRRYHGDDLQTRRYMDEVDESGDSVLLVVKPDRIVAVDAS